MRGFLIALFAGGLGLAVLAGPAPCPTCDPAHGDGQRDAKRVLSRLTYALGEAVELAEREGLRFVTNIVGGEVGDVHIGMPVRVKFEQQEDVWLPLFEADPERSAA